MNKKIRSIICFALIIIISIPAVSIVFARKPGRGPLEKIVYIHHRKDYAKPPWAGSPGGPNGDGEEEEGYYTFLARGVKWKEEELPVEYVINPTLESDKNPKGLPEEFITEAIFASAKEWDSWTGADLFGSYTVNYYATWDTETPDYKNELVFGDYPQEDVIAVCIVWGYFTGPPSTRRIVEFDIMFDINFIWGDATENSNVMDLQNIVTHELGHGVGLGDLYITEASDETMYGYSDYGETKKRDLYFGDKAGIKELYGPVE